MLPFEHAGMLRTKNNPHPESLDSWEANMTMLRQFETRWAVFGKSPLRVVHFSIMKTHDFQEIMELFVELLFINTLI